MIETLTPNDMANSLKLHPFTQPLHAGAGFTVTRLARQKGKRFDDVTDLTMGEASAKIDELMAA